MDLYFELPEDLPTEWRDSKKITSAIALELAKQGIAGEVDWKPDPLSRGEKDRELILVILAVGAASVLVAHAVKKVLDNIHPDQPTVVYEKKVEPMLANGKPVIGADGRQLMKYTETPVVVQPGGSSESISLNAFKVFEIRSASEKHAPGEKSHPAPGEKSHQVSSGKSQGSGQKSHGASAPQQGKST